MIYLKYISIFLLSVLFFFTIGGLLLKFVKVKITEFYLSTLLNLLIGMVFCTTFYAIFFTKAISILTFFLFIFLLTYLRLPNKRDSVDLNIFRLFTKERIVHVFFILTIIIISVFFKRLPYLYFPNYFADYVTYSKVSEYITLGNENVFREGILINNLKGVIPYHYFELWLTSMLSETFNLLHLLCYDTIVKANLILLFIVSILALCETFTTIIFRHMVFSLLLIFFGGVYLSLFDKFNFIAEYNEMQEFSIFSSLGLAKIYLISIFLVIIFITILKNKNEFILPLILSIVLINFLSTAGLLSAFISLTIISLFFNDTQTKKKKIIDIIICILFFVGVISFYYLFKTDIEYKTDKPIINVILTNISIWKTKINYIIGVYISHFAYTLLLVPFLLFGLDKLKKSFYVKKYFYIYLLVFLILVFSNVISSILAGVPDYTQIYTNNFTPLLYIFPLFIYLLLKDKPLIQTLYFILLLFIAGFKIKEEYSYRKNKANYSQEYLIKIKKELVKINKPLGTCFYSTTNKSSGAMSYCTLGEYLKLMKPKFNTVNLASIYMMDTVNSSKIKFLSNHPIMLYKMSNKIKNNDDVISSYFKKFNPQYLIINANENVPKVILDKVKYKFKDSISGETFCLLK